MIERRLMIRIAGAVGGLALLVGAMAWLAGAFTPTIAPEPLTAAPSPVEGTVVTVEAVSVAVSERAPGTVQAKREAILSPRITASIVAVNARAGDRVKQDEVLVELDRRELESRLEQRRERVAGAKARVDEARRRFDRVEALFRSGTVSRAELDQAEADLLSAEAELARAREVVDEASTALSYATIRAPMDGRIIDRLAEPGDTARPGVALLRLYDPQTLRLDSHVRESLATRLERGDHLLARIDAPDVEVEVTVDEIVPSAEPGSRTVLVRASLPRRDDLFPGMFGRLIIPTGSERRLYIPAAALERVGQLEFVTVVMEQGALRRYVRTGKRSQDHGIEVLSGLEAGERVVVDR
jgi:RND family efflux transporter MFP subunit